MRSRYQKRHPLKGLIVGAISGLAGTFAMTQFQNVWNRIGEEMQEPRAEPEAKPAEEQEKEDSTMKAAGKISEEIGRPLSRDERKKAGPWVHYAFGTSVGAVFGLAAEVEPVSVRGINPVFAGAAYGAAVFLAAHEIAVPALKLSSNPRKEPIPDQIAEFVSHLIYGIGTALTYHGIKRLKR
jgi:putative membrane protein